MILVSIGTFVAVALAFVFHKTQEHRWTCLECRGTGRLVRNGPCSYCGGSGRAR